MRRRLKSRALKDLEQADWRSGFNYPGGIVDDHIIGMKKPTSSELRVDEDYRPKRSRGRSVLSLVQNHHYLASRNSLSESSSLYPPQLRRLVHRRAGFNRMRVNTMTQEAYARIFYNQEEFALVDVSNTSVRLEQNIEINSAAGDLLQRFDQNTLRGITRNPLINVARDIYKNLYINRSRGFSHFSLVFKWVGGSGSFFVDKIRKSIFIRVKLAKNINVQIAETMYIAYRIAKNFRDWLDESENVDTTTIFDITAITIRQHCDNNYYTFSHAIRRSFTTVDFWGLGCNSADREMRHDFKNFKKWLEANNLMLTSPGSYNNCFAAALITTLKDICFENLTIKERKDKVQNPAYKLNRSAGITGLTLESLVAAFDGNKILTGKTVFVHNYMGTVVGILQGPNPIEISNVYHMLVFANHAFGLVTKRDVPNEAKYEGTVIRQKNISEKDEYRPFGVYDIETTIPGVLPYLFGCIMPETDLPVIFRGLDCIAQFLDYIDSIGVKVVTLYAHYGGKFDSVLIANTIFKKTCPWRVIRIMEKSGSMYKLVIYLPAHMSKSGHSVTINLVDSFNLLPRSLADLSKAFDIKRKKMAKINYHAINKYNFAQEIEAQNIIEYLKYDLYSLMDVLKLFNNDLYETYGIYPVVNMISLASVVRFVFLAKFYDAEKTPLINLTEQTDKKIRKHAYYGGRNEVFQVGEIKEDVSAVDFVSFYPKQAKKDLPYGVPVFLEFNELPENFFGFVEFIVIGGRSSKFNVIREKMENGNEAPVYNSPTKKLLFSEEFRWIYEHREHYQYSILILGGIEFKKAKFLNGMVELFFIKKRDALNPVQRFIAKILLNCIYGIFALKFRDKSIIRLNSPEQLSKYVVTGNLLAINGEFAKVEDYLYCSLRSVPVAAAITSYAHLELCKAMHEIETRGYKTYYVDTDSLKTNAPIEVFQNMGIWGTGLGQLCYEENNVRRLVIIGKKLYAMNNIIKMKGIPARRWRKDYIKTGDEITEVHYYEAIDGELVNYEDMMVVLKGGTLNFHTTRYIGGKRAWLKTVPTLDYEERVIKIRGNLFGQRQSSTGKILPPKKY